MAGQQLKQWLCCFLQQQKVDTQTPYLNRNEINSWLTLNIEGDNREEPFQHYDDLLLATYMSRNYNKVPKMLGEFQRFWVVYDWVVTQLVDTI